MLNLIEICDSHIGIYFFRDENGRIFEIGIVSGIADQLAVSLKNVPVWYCDWKLKRGLL